jgi:hypothetical protein
VRDDATSTRDHPASRSRSARYSVPAYDFFLHLELVWCCTIAVPPLVHSTLESTVATGIVYLYPKNGAQQNLVHCMELSCQRKLKGMLLIYMRRVILTFSVERCLGSVENAHGKCIPALVRARQHPDPDQASEGENPPAPLQIILFRTPYM